MPRILVVEDEIALLEEIVDTLGYEGYEAIGAEDGQVGLYMAQEYLPDLIISDIMMPKLDGYGMVEALRQIPETAAIPIIFLTTLSDRPAQRRGMEVGADDFLSKPFEKEELLAAVLARLKRQNTIIEATSQSLEAAKRKLTHLISHELRTPLVSISVVQDILLDPIENLAQDDLHDLVSLMSSGTRRLHRIVEEMTLFVQLETELLSVQSIKASGKPLEVDIIIQDALLMAHHYVRRATNARVDVDLQVGSVAIWCDDVSLKHAFAEVICNALTVSDDDSVITIQQWIDSGYQVVRVIDQGYGMSSDQVDDAKKPFQQIDRELHEQQGIGLGLTVADRIITAHRGKLTLHSEPNKGTQAIIVLPCYQSG